MDYKIIDDFLPKEELTGLYNLLTNPDKFAWFYMPSVVNFKDTDKDKTHFYFTHTFYDNFVQNSSHFKEMDIVFKAFKKHQHKVKALMRVKANLYTRTNEIIIHEKHNDFPFEHKGGLLSLNTCDGFTQLEDGTKINSLANRMLIFDASKSHSSTTCTNENLRLNINFNFF